MVPRRFWNVPWSHSDCILCHPQHTWCNNSLHALSDAELPCSLCLCRLSIWSSDILRSPSFPENTPPCRCSLAFHILPLSPIPVKQHISYHLCHGIKKRQILLNEGIPVYSTVLWCLWSRSGSCPHQNISRSWSSSPHKLHKTSLLPHNKSGMVPRHLWHLEVSWGLLPHHRLIHVYIIPSFWDLWNDILGFPETIRK